MTTRRYRHQRGLALVETAIVLSLLLMLTLGLIEYGWLFLKAQQVTNAARQGARVAIRADSTYDDVLTAVEEMMQKGDMADVKVDYTPTITVKDYQDGTEKLWADAVPGDLIEVRISVPTENIAIMKSALMPLPDNLVAAISMAKEGPAN